MERRRCFSEAPKVDGLVAQSDAAVKQEATLLNLIDDQAVKSPMSSPSSRQRNSKSESECVRDASGDNSEQVNQVFKRMSNKNKAPPGDE